MQTDTLLGRDGVPSLPMPSQSYVEQVIARKLEPPSPRAQSNGQLLTPRSGQSRKHMRIFYHLDEVCPEKYFPALHEVNQSRFRAIRHLLQVLCIVQLLASGTILVLLEGKLHDYVYELFTSGAVLLCGFAAFFGLLGVCFKNRALLLFFYINQLWSLSNVCTFFVMYMQSNESTRKACSLLLRGDLSAEQAVAMALDCTEVDRKNRETLVVMVTLLIQMWVSSFLCRTYSEMIQDMRSDDDDRALIEFAWQRRRDLWKELRRFEDVVQRQFEELRSSLVSRQGVKQLMLGPASTPGL